MTPVEVRELFRVLGNMPQFRQWLDQEEADVVRALKGGEGTALLRNQGKAALLDDMRRLLESK